MVFRTNWVNVLLCLEGTIKSTGPKRTDGLASILGLGLFHILINDLDKNFDENLLKCTGDLKMGCG